MRREYSVEGNLRPSLHSVISNPNRRSVSVRVNNSKISRLPAVGEHVPAKSCRPRLSQHDRRQNYLNEPEEHNEAGDPRVVAVTLAHDVSRLTDISDLMSLIGRILHVSERAWVRVPPRMCLASKNPTGGPNCDAQHDAADILTDISPAFLSSLRPRSQATHAGQPVGTVSAQIRH
jgi:hypothetical protein